jgi:hypothetical protein
MIACQAGRHMKPLNRGNRTWIRLAAELLRTAGHRCWGKPPAPLSPVMGGGYQ